MKKCSKCVMPDTAETLTFDKNGVCSVCNQIEQKKNKAKQKQDGAGGPCADNGPLLVRIDMIQCRLIISPLEGFLYPH